MIELLLALLACALLGWVIDRGLLGDPGAGVIERGGRALMLGLGGLGVLSMAVDMAGVGVGPATLGAAWLATVLLLLRPALRSRPRPPTPEGPATPLERAALWGMAVLAVASLALPVRAGVIRPAFQFDSLTRWMFKTKVLVLDGTLMGAVSTDPSLWFTHQRYPPLVSHVSALPAWFASLMGAEVPFDDRIASAIYPWFAVALVAVLYGAVARRAGRTLGALVAAWVASLPLIAFISGPPPGAGAFSALADVPLALFAAGAGMAAADALEGRRDRAWLETGLLLTFAALTKNEGLPLVASVLVAVLLCARRARWRVVLGVGALTAVGYVLLWGLYVATSVPGLDENYWERLHGDAVSEGLGRIPMIVVAFVEGMLDPRVWNVTWVAVAALLAAGWQALRRPALRMLLIAVVLQLLAYAFAYMVTQWSSPRAEAVLAETGQQDPLVVLFELTMGRLLLHVAPLAIACAVLAAPFRGRGGGPEGAVAAAPAGQESSGAG